MSFRVNIDREHMAPDAWNKYMESIVYDVAGTREFSFEWEKIKTRVDDKHTPERAKEKLDAKARVAVLRKKERDAKAAEKAAKAALDATPVKSKARVEAQAKLDDASKKVTEAKKLADAEALAKKKANEKYKGRVCNHYVPYSEIKDAIFLAVQGKKLIEVCGWLKGAVFAIYSQGVIFTLADLMVTHPFMDTNSNHNMTKQQLKKWRDSIEKMDAATAAKRYDECYAKINTEKTRVMVEQWTIWAVEAICDYPDNLFYGPSTGDVQGSAVDVPTKQSSCDLVEAGATRLKAILTKYLRIVDVKGRRASEDRKNPREATLSTKREHNSIEKFVLDPNYSSSEDEDYTDDGAEDEDDDDDSDMMDTK